MVCGRYEPIGIAELAGGVSQGHSQVLNVDWRWQDGELCCHNPAASRHIATFEGERARADAAEARAEDAHNRAENERARADSEHAARVAAEARIRELEARVYNTGL